MDGREKTLLMGCCTPLICGLLQQLYLLLEEKAHDVFTIITLPLFADALLLLGNNMCCISKPKQTSIPIQQQLVTNYNRRG